MSGSTAKKHTLTYRTVRGLDIKLDYVLPPDLDDGESKYKEPVVVWFHGGGLLQGSREYPPPHLESAAAKHRVCVVSADYRLAPQTRLPEILSDLTSLFSYLVSPAFDSATKSRIDTSRIVTMGSSAGGWLSLLSGLNVGFEESGTRYEAELKDRVKGVVGIYPITSVEHEFWHTKQSRVSYYDRRIEKEELKTQLDPKSDEIANVGDNDERNKMYTYMIQEACLENLLLDGTGVDPSAFTVAKAIRLGKTVDPLPPIYLVHGTNDDKVPHAQSVEVVEALRERKKNGANELSFEYEEKQGLDHGYDYAESETMSEMWAWVVEKLDEK